MSLSNFYNILCTPPPPPKPDDIVSSPPTCCPVDCLGYPQKCCSCIPLVNGATIICVMSFMWAIIELVQSEKVMDIIFHENDDLSIYFKLVYNFVIIIYLATCFMLMIGIMSRNVQLIQTYVFMACIFNCICITIKIMSVAVRIFEGSLEKKSLVGTVLAVLWYTSFFYYISVVNSLKYQIWYYPYQ